METTSIRSTSRINNILLLVKKMPAKQQIELEYLLKRMLLMEQAERLEKSVKKNTLTLKDIVEEVKKVRHEN
ncbi:MAG: hypothetical protein IJU33_02255 [Bacteroidales bacterium]|nr:hypothetical protein [Bacteroidales bacterium]